jgi:adenylate cyclase class 2
MPSRRSEKEGRSVIEAETIVDEDDVHTALADVRQVLAELGIGEQDLTTELYTDAVVARRNA